MIDRDDVIKKLKTAHDALADSNPMVMERIYYDDTLLEDKTTSDYQTALAICTLMDVIEQIEAEPYREWVEYDFDETRYRIAGLPDEFFTEGDACSYAAQTVENNTNGKTFTIIQRMKGDVTQEYLHATFHVASLQENK